MKKLTLTLFIFLNALIMVSQVVKPNIKKLVVHFENNSWQVSNEYKTLISESVDKLKDKKILQITFKGHTDTKGDSLYNITLSQKRIESVTEVFKKSGINENLFRQYAYGYNRLLINNETEIADKKNRRVEVLIFWEDKESIRDSSESDSKVLIPNTDSVLIVEDECVGKDTVFPISGGMYISYNTCQQSTFENTVQIEDKFGLDLLGDSIHLMDTEGSDLESGGMAFFTLKQEDVNCDSPYVMLIPIDDNNQGFQFYTFEKGKWKVINSNSSKNKVKINHKEYLKLTLTCEFLSRYLVNGVYRFGINKDKRLRNDCLSKIKVKKGYKILWYSAIATGRMILVKNIKFRRNYNPRVLKLNLTSLLNNNYKVEMAVLNLNTNDTIILKQNDLKRVIRGIGPRTRWFNFSIFFKKCDTCKRYRVRKKSILKEEREKLTLTQDSRKS